MHPGGVACGSVVFGPDGGGPLHHEERNCGHAQRDKPREGRLGMLSEVCQIDIVNILLLLRY